MTRGFQGSFNFLNFKEVSKVLLDWQFVSKKLTRCPNGVFKDLSEKFKRCFKSVSTGVQSSRCRAIFRGFDFKRFSF